MVAKAPLALRERRKDQSLPDDVDNLCACGLQSPASHHMRKINTDNES